MSLDSSHNKTLLPFWERCTPSAASRPGTVWINPWSKNPKCCLWHQGWIQEFILWIFLNVFELVPATVGMEEDTTCAASPLVSWPRALKSFLTDTKPAQVWLFALEAFWLSVYQFQPVQEYQLLPTALTLLFQKWGVITAHVDFLTSCTNPVTT